ncbi:MAG: AAA family ATPase [Bacteroidales bacterium]|nr:AAA family ATPase [Bacteroidales bacterium]
MQKFADYIDRIEINSLWSGHKHIVWKLRPGVNVLSGKNGAGKSTILTRIMQHVASIAPTGEIRAREGFGVKIDFVPAEAVTIRYDIIRSIDRQLVTGDRIATLAEGRVVTELDWQIYELQRRYLDYQVNVGNRMIQLLTSGDPAARERATEAAGQKTKFQDLIDELFAETGKKIDRQHNELRFFQYGETIPPYLLSSGEKQILVILLTALCEDMLPYVILMDEPEISLHFDWQKRLIDMVQTLNPNAQIILTTHSPAVIMDGWEDAVTEVSEITRPTPDPSLEGGE